MDTIKKFENLLVVFARIMNKLKEAEKTPLNYGSGERLYSSEIHTIAFIGSNPGINVTNLANMLGVTKGAVSQVVKKLEKKNLVERFKDDTNNKEIHLRLTRKGEIDYHGHESNHAKYDSEWLDTLDRLTPEQTQLLEFLVGKMEESIDRQLKQFR